MRWIIYARKSDDDTRVTEKSIGEQVKESRLVAARDSLEVTAVYEESKSAKIPFERPLFDEMMKRVASGEVGGILCWHVNRLARNMAEGGMIAHLMAEGKLKEIRTPSSVYKTGDNIIPLVVETGTSTQFSLEVSRNVSRGLKGHFERGGTTYKAPAGYRNQRDPDNSKRGIVIKDEPRFSLIRRGFELLSTGGYTIAQVRTMLNETLGYRSRQGEPLSSAGAHKMFRDPFYMGYVRHKGELGLGAHEAMLTPAEFAHVQRVLDNLGLSRPRKSKGGHQVPKHAYLGLMRCAYCGQQVTADRHVMSSGKPYVSYHCGDSKGRCTKRGMSLLLLEEAFLEELSRIEIDDRLMREALGNIKRALKLQSDQMLSDVSRAGSELERINKKLWRLREMYLDGMIDSEADYQEHVKSLKKEKEKAQFLAITSDQSYEEASQSAENAARFLLNACKRFTEGSLEEKREIIGALATGYRFFGREKRLEIDLDPVLACFVGYTDSLRMRASKAQFNEGLAHNAGVGQPEVRVTPNLKSGMFELAKSGSGTTKNAPVREAFFSGEPPEITFELQQIGAKSSDTRDNSILNALLVQLLSRAFPVLGFLGSIAE